MAIVGWLQTTPRQMSMWILSERPEADDDPLTFRLSCRRDQDHRPRRARRLHRRSRARLAPALPADRGRREARGRGSREHERHVRQRQARRTRADRQRRPAARRTDRADRCTRKTPISRRPLRPQQNSARRVQRFWFHVVTRNGLVRRSRPMVVSGPWPGWTTASSPNANSTVRIDSDERGVIAARQVGAADRSGEERVADEQVLAAPRPSFQSADRHRPDNVPAYGAGALRACRTESPGQACSRRRSAAAARRAGRTWLPTPPAWSYRNRSSRCR